MTWYRSFAVAFRGIARVATDERSFRVQLVAGAAVVVLMMLFDLKPWEYIVLTLLIALVLILEILNTVVEHFVDMVKPRLHVHAGGIKDMMAGAVLLMSAASAVIGFVIFFPHIVRICDTIIP